MAAVAKPRLCRWVIVLAATVVGGCAHQAPAVQPIQRSWVLVVAPVLNLSGSQDFDPLKVTDLLASEFTASGNISTIPVNRVLAELARQGKATVETPADAVRLARVFGADATVVVAVTEYSPYDPPLVGAILQWYDAPARDGDLQGAPEGQKSAGSALRPRWQIERVFNSADSEVVEDVRRFAARRDAEAGPYGWRRYLKSQELYVRYCWSALIEPMQRQNAGSRPVTGAQAGS
jgi:hypothetical protein